MIKTSEGGGTVMGTGGGAHSIGISIIIILCECKRAKDDYRVHKN